jgi:hypothetical protein
MTACTTAGALITPGRVVEYHGSRTDAHGRYVIAGYAGGRFTLMDPDYPGDQFIISRVHRQSIRITGSVIQLCAHCLHPASGTYGKPGGPGWTCCWWCRDMCTSHGLCLAGCAAHDHCMRFGWDAPVPQGQEARR